MPQKILISGILFILTSYTIGNSSSVNDILSTPSKIHSLDYNKLISEGIESNVLDYAMKGYKHLYEQGIIQKDSILTIIDYSKVCNTDRFFVINLNSGEVIYKCMVAHGVKSGEYIATSFSNKARSHKSSLGFYVTQNTYYGKHGYSLRINGLEKKYNSNAISRAVVIHGADYVSKEYIIKNGRIGRSFGCPALPESLNDQIIDCIKEGSCLFVYYPDQKYLKNSEILN
jgi:hypothetical protein